MYNKYNIFCYCIKNEQIKFLCSNKRMNKMTPALLRVGTLKIDSDDCFTH